MRFALQPAGAPDIERIVNNEAVTQHLLIVGERGRQDERKCEDRRTPLLRAG
jgi:hypothetical protein